VKNIVELDRPYMTIWRMRIECWVPKATNTHSEYVILIAFPLQQWLNICASVFRYIASLVNFDNRRGWLWCLTVWSLYLRHALVKA